MKKNLLTVFAVCGMLFSASAQDFENGDKGFVVDYTGTDADFASCLSDQPLPSAGGYQYAGGNLADNTKETDPDPVNGSPVLADHSGDIYLSFIAGASAPATTDPFYLDIYTSQSGACKAMRNDGAIGIDLTNNAKVQIVARASADDAVLRIYLASSTGAFPTNTFNTGSGASIVREVKLTKSFTTYTVNLTDVAADATTWSAWSGKSKVNMLGFTLGTANATYDIQSVTLGDLVVTSTNAAVLPSTVKFGPNPSDSYINVNGIEVSTLKVLDMNGSVIRTSNTSSVEVAGLTSGLYFLQVNGFKPVKVMVK